MKSPEAIPAAADLAVNFFNTMARGDADAAVALLHPDILYTNVGWPTLRHAGTARVLGALRGPGSFNVEFLTVSADGNTVLTERMDELAIGRFRWQFWACGRIELRDGLVVGWRDYVDHAHLAITLLRAVAAILIPSMQRPLPAPPSIG
ncbi:limonene-1,2-epoxide hydrolase family protein [Williamsia maris]|uniref:Limonene-1,2-epoxide hydrolase n=1 Tax=Williamsia maris TaxID=72806 RepID=A0ABT1HJG4_9NOCA|nr:limonene-1,2-epoxide hydrolase family protein [Williamsia maris]MCP2178080.1 limonene-1,2-epoxide hydrolase [Williamsia maris]